MNALTQKISEPLIAFEGFCIAQECALDENNNIDFETIAIRLRAIHKRVILASEVEDWAIKYNWNFRLKLARAELYEKHRPKFEEQAGNLKLRRMSVVNDNIRFLLEACLQLQVKIKDEINDMPLKDAIATYERFLSLTLRLFEIERQESGEQDFRDTSFNLNVFMNEAARDHGWDSEKAEMLKARLAARLSRLGPPTLTPVSELLDATHRRIDEVPVER